MENNEITIEEFKKSRLFTNSIIGFIISAALFVAILLCVIIGAGTNTLNENAFIGIVGGIGTVAFVAAIVSAVAFVIGLIGKITYSDFVKKNGEDAIMRELSESTVYVYYRKKKPVTIITRYHIFELGYSIMSSKDIDYAYGYSYKGSTSIRAFYITNKSLGFARGIPLRSNEMKECFAALKTINPDILLGFTGENAREHKARVKEYKERKNQ